MRRRSCFAWSTLAVWRPRCVKRCGLSCWAIISLECPWTREKRYIILRRCCGYSQPLQLKISLSTPHLQVDEQVRASYQQTMSEWLSCEEIVRQREKEQHVAALAKCSSGASMDSSSQKMILNDSINNEVKPHVSSFSHWHLMQQPFKIIPLMFFSGWLSFPFVLHASCSVTVVQALVIVPVEQYILQSCQTR